MAQDDKPDGGLPDRREGKAALLLIDVINDLEFPGAERLEASVEAMIELLVALRSAAERAGLPVVFVNDNFGEWHSDRDAIVARVVSRDCRGRRLAERLHPREADYFIIKPQVSGFYATNLPVLLPQLGVTRLILAGIAADICVLFTAADAHMRDYDLWIPADLVAAEDGDRARWALDIMRNSMAAEIRPTDELTLESWLGA